MPDLALRGRRSQSLDASWFSAHIDPYGQPVFTGEFDAAGLDSARVVLDQALLESQDDITVDASGLTFLDSDAIRELLRYKVRASASGRRLWLEALSPELTRVLGILDLQHILLRPE